MRHIMIIASKCMCDFDCDWQRVNAFSCCVTLMHVLLLQIISHSDTKVPALVIMECKRAKVIYVYELIFLLHTSRSTECSFIMFTSINKLYCRETRKVLIN